MTKITTINKIPHTELKSQIETIMSGQNDEEYYPTDEIGETGIAFGFSLAKGNSLSDSEDFAYKIENNFFIEIVDNPSVFEQNHKNNANYIEMTEDQAKTLKGEMLSRLWQNGEYYDIERIGNIGVAFGYALGKGYSLFQSWTFADDISWEIAVRNSNYNPF